MQEASKLEVLKISEILPNRFQPRIKFDDESLNQLAASIARFGVIEPIVVRPIGQKYEIIAGERRFKASKLAGKSTIPAMILNLSDKDSEELALLENIQRKSLSPIEEAVSYKRILDSGYISRDELSRKIGKPQSLIFNKIKLLDLSDEVQSYLLNNKISERHARSLLKIDNLSDQVDMLHRIVKERLTVKATDREIDKLLEKNKGINNKKQDNKLKMSEDSDVTENLFDDERGSENMDIDKIMQEAKDINAPETNVSNEPAPDLMAPGNDVQNDSQANNSNNSQNVEVAEQGKFLKVVPQDNVQNENNNVVSSDSGVTFDNMFNTPATSIDKTLPVANSNESLSGDKDILSASAPFVEPFVKPAPELVTPIQNEVSTDKTVEPSASTPVSTMSENGQEPIHDVSTPIPSDLPNSSSVESNPATQPSVSPAMPELPFPGPVESVPAAQPSVSPAMPELPVSGPVESTPAAQPSVSPTMPELPFPGPVEPTPAAQPSVSPAMPELPFPGPVEPTPAAQPSVSPAMPELPFPGPVEPTPAAQPSVSPATPELPVPGPVESVPAAQPSVSPAMPELPGPVEPTPAAQPSVSPAMPELPFPGTVESVPAAQPSVSPAMPGLSFPGPVESVPAAQPSVSPAMPELPFPGPVEPMPTVSNPDSSAQSISDAVSDAFKKYNDNEISNNIPDVNIYNDNNIQPVSGGENVITDNNSLNSLDGNVVTESPNIPNFAKIVKMLRDCADEIQRNGYYVNVDEMDMDGKYKVIFTIDKE